MDSKEQKKVLPNFVATGYGFNLCGVFSLEAFRSALRYKPRSDDLFIVTYPKCGTTWVQNIVACIYREGKPFSNALEFLTNTPFLEMAGAEAAETMQRPGAIKLHLPFHLTPWSKEAKYIFVARNPKDCVVSFYHHTKNMIGYGFQNGTFDDYFELFMDGEVDFGDYFDTLISWYQRKDEPNVLFITYEQLKKDAKAYVLKIAEFMGQKYKDMLVENNSILDDVLTHSSFDFMKQSLNRQMTELATLPKDFVQNHPDIPPGLKNIIGVDSLFDSNPDAVTFVRKGIVGDYKNHLSAEQNRRLEEKFMEKTRGTDIAQLWPDIIKIEASEEAALDISSKPQSHKILGLTMPRMFSTPSFISAVGYKPRPDDVFIVTYPKCGTTWTQQTVMLIFSQGQPLKSWKDFFATTPFLEATGADMAEKMPRPNAIKVHLPYHLTPRSDKAKYIYVTRNPKDCCVSYFHHNRNMPIHGFEGTFDDFFELFIDGETDYGDYFDHLLGWYAHRNDPNILFVTYEEMKEHPKEAILKMASFIDDAKYGEPLRSDPEKLSNVLEYSSLKYMKNLNTAMDQMFTMTKDEILQSDLPDGFKHMLSRFSELAEHKDVTPKKSEFVRKGIVGDWRNYFSEEQSRMLDEKFRERTSGTDIPDMFKKYM